MKAKRKRRAKMGPRFRRRTPPGAAPGTVAVDPQAARPVLHLVSYGPDDYEERDLDDLAALASLVGRQPVTWVDVQGLGDAQTITRLGEIFSLHPLTLEDVVNTHQRAKVEDYGRYLFLVARMLVPGKRWVAGVDGHQREALVAEPPGPRPSGGSLMLDPGHPTQLGSEQLSIFLGRNFVLTFQERPGDCLDPVRERLRTGKARIRHAGPDFLAYAILDAVVDAYFPALENYGEQLDRLDEEISSHPVRETFGRIHDLRADLLLLRRAIWPLREDVGTLARESNPLISDETRVFLRDCYDHTVQIIELVEACREMCQDLRDYYLSVLNIRMSEVMKVLTVIATIFIPLSFIAGVYGMNFDPDVSPWNMPELRWSHGYPFALGLMVAEAGGLLFFFWRRGWLRS